MDDGMGVPDGEGKGGISGVHQMDNGVGVPKGEDLVRDQGIHEMKDGTGGCPMEKTWSWTKV